MALMLSSYSLPTAVSKLVSERVASGKRRNAFRVFVCSLVFAFIVGLIITLAIFFGAGAISEYVMKSPLSVYALKVLAPGLFIVAVMAVLRGYFQGLNTMVPTAISQIIEQLVNAVVSIVGASILFGIGIRAGEKAGEETAGTGIWRGRQYHRNSFRGCCRAFVSHFCSLAVQGVIKKQLKRDRTRGRESYSHILKVLIFTAVPVILSTAVYNINQILDLTIFNHIMDAQGYVEQEYMALQGIYTAKYDTLINVPMAIPYALSASIVPSLTAVVTAGTQKQVHYKIDQTIRLTMFLTIPCGVGFIALASPLMVLLYNDASATPANLLMLGAAVVVLYGWSSVSNSVLHGLNHMSSPAKNAGIFSGNSPGCIYTYDDSVQNECVCACMQQYCICSVHVLSESAKDTKGMRVPGEYRTYICKTADRRSGYGDCGICGSPGAGSADRRQIYSYYHCNSGGCCGIFCNCSENRNIIRRRY